MSIDIGFHEYVSRNMILLNSLSGIGINLTVSIRVLAQDDPNEANPYPHQA